MVSNSRVCSKQQGIFSKKVSLFMENYSRKLGMGADIRRKGKVERVMLQTQDFRVSQEKEPYIRISIRELDRILNTN